MMKKGTEMTKFEKSLDQFFDKNAQLVFDSLKNDSPDQFNIVMNRVMEEFLGLPIPNKRKPRTVKRKVRRGIGSY